MGISETLGKILGLDLPIRFEAWDGSTAGPADASSKLLLCSPRVVSALHRSRFEVRHLESLREHYALTLRRWVDNLRKNWDEAVAHVGIGRTRTGLLYLAAAGVGFETNKNQIHQVLAVRPDGNRSGMPLRPRFE